MQSQRCAAPPTMSRSISVTSAPSDAATVAAVLPRGTAADDHESYGHAVQATRPRAAYPDPSMQQLLVDELTGDRVILAPGARTAARHLPQCTPIRAPRASPIVPVLRRQRARDAARGRTVRPRRARHAGLDAPGGPEQVPDRRRTAYAGVHEVVIFSPAHDADLSALLGRGRGRRARSRSATAPASISRTDAVTCRPFVNQGKAAGASIEHPHAQLVALDFVPPRAAGAPRSASTSGGVRRRSRTPSTCVDGDASSRGARRVADARSRVRLALDERRPAVRRSDRRRRPRRRRRACSDALVRDPRRARRRRVQRHDRDRAARPRPGRSVGGSTSFPASRCRPGFELGDRPVGEHRRARRRGRGTAGGCSEDPGRRSRSTRRPTDTWRRGRTDRAPRRLDGRRGRRSGSPARTHAASAPTFDCVTQGRPDPARPTA